MKPFARRLEITELHSQSRAMRRRRPRVLLRAGSATRILLFVLRKVLGQLPFFLRQPLKNVIDATIHEDQFHFGVFESVGNRLILRGEFRQRSNHTQRRPGARKGLCLPGERLQGDRQPAVAQFVQ